MDPETRDIDMWMKKTLNNWAEQGTLSLEKSAQLQMNIAELANQERKNHFTRKVCSIVAAIITFIWLIFGSCPVAAASYVDRPIHSAHFSQVIIVSLFIILICFFLNFLFRTANSNFEVDYE